MSFNTTHGLQDKTEDGFSSNPILLLKVNYPSTSKYGENQVNFASIDQDGIASSILDCNEPLSEQNIEICDKESSYPMLLLHSDIAQQEIVETSVDPRSVFSNFLFASLPKNDLCTVSAKDFEDVANAPESTVTVSSIEHQVNHLIETEDHSKQDQIIQEISTIENEYLERQIYQVEGNSSSEDDDGDEVCKVIYDKPVVCRARGTLPRQYLYLDYPSKNKNLRGSLGVFANKMLPKKTLFGPMEGILVDFEETSDDFKLLVVFDEGVKKLDVSNENLSNWMRYVRPANCREEQNVSVYQHGRNLYFRTIRRIAPDEELRVWYDPDYAKLRNLQSFIPPKKKQKPLLLVRPIQNLDINQQEEKREWKCSRCNCTFNSATLLNLHVLTHAADNIETEGLEMASDCIDQNELVQLHYENEHVCKQCSTSFPSDADLKIHLSTHEDQTYVGNKEKYFTCQTCSKSFSTNSGLKNHLKKNNCKSEERSTEQESAQKAEKKSFTCKECSESFTSNTALTRHMKTHGPQKIFECPICKNVFVSVLLLKDHIHRHAVDGIYKCPHCSKEFKRYKPIRNHIRSYHSKKQCICHICNKAFSSNEKLKLHHLRHSDHRNFSCSVCGQKFKRKDKVVAHLRRFHINSVKKAKPKKKVNRCSLDSSSYNEMVYKCHICFVGFKRRGMLVNHQAKMHPDVPQESFPELNLPILKDEVLYFCQYCDKKYKSSTKRKFHVLKVHPGESLPPSYSKAASEKNKFNSMYCKTVGSVMTRPHSCQWCFKQYATNGKLLDHQRKCHLDLLPKALQVPLRSKKTSQTEEDIQYKDTLEPLLPNPLDSNISDFEMTLGDTRVTEGEFIIDAATLRKAVKEDVLSAELSSENLAELSQLIESRPDQYFKVYQTSSGLTFARPVEVWDPISTCQTLSPSTNDNDFFEPV